MEINFAGDGGDLGLPGADGSLRFDAEPPGFFFDIVGGAAGNALEIAGHNVSLDTTNNVTGPIN